MRGLVQVVLLLVLVLNVLHSSAALLQLLDSDTLYPAGIYHNLFVMGYDLSSEAYNDHPGFFPDCFVYWPLLALLPLGPATAIYAVLWVACLLGLSYLILRKVGLDRSLASLGTLLAVQWQMEIMQVPKPAAPEDRQILQILYAHSHGTAILLALLLGLLVLGASAKNFEYRLRMAALLFVPMVLAVVSDKIVIAHTLAPLCLAVLVYSFTIRDIGWKLWLGFGLGSSLGGLLVITLLPHWGLGRFDGAYAVSKVSASIDLTFLKDIGKVMITYPVIGLAVLAWLISTIASMGSLRSRASLGDEDRAYIFLQTLLVSMALLTLAAIAVSKFWTGLVTLRYIYPFLLSGPLGLVLALSRSERKPGLYLALALLLLLGSGPTFARQWTEFRWQQLKTPYPEDIQCLDKLAEAFDLKYGYSEYWSARRANLLSRRNLQVTPIDPQANFVPYTMSLNLDSIPAPEKVQFVLTPRLSETMILKFFGQARSVEKCESMDVFIIEPQNSVLTGKSNEGSLLHIAMLGLGEGSRRNLETGTIESPKSADGSRIVSFGPYMSLAPGEYELSMEFESEDETGEGGLLLEVVGHGRQLAQVERSLSTLGESQGKQIMGVDFVVDKTMVGHKFEFRTWKTGSYNLEIRRLCLKARVALTHP